MLSIAGNICGKIERKEISTLGTDVFLQDLHGSTVMIGPSYAQTLEHMRHTLWEMHAYAFAAVWRVVMMPQAGLDLTAQDPAAMTLEQAVEAGARQAVVIRVEHPRGLYTGIIVIGERDQDGDRFASIHEGGFMIYGQKFENQEQISGLGPGGKMAKLTDQRAVQLMAESASSANIGAAAGEA